MRAKLRYNEEVRRISAGKVWEELLHTNSAERLIQNASMPYLPKCNNKELAKRIMVTAQQVRLFSKVKHLTSGKHITNIFDDALYGRRQLLASYLPFKPASLYQYDVEEGDGNVICFGHPRATGEGVIELTFDLDKIAENNPTIFYKQRDLGFDLEKTREIVINPTQSKPLYFSHTKYIRAGFSSFNVYDRQGESRIATYTML